jgi:hypothetical protein
MFRLRLCFVGNRFICGRNIANSRGIDFIVDFALLDKQQTSGVTVCGGVGSGVRLVDGTLGRILFRRILVRVLGRLGDFN